MCTAKLFPSSSCNHHSPPSHCTYRTRHWFLQTKLSSCTLVCAGTRLSNSPTLHCPCSHTDRPSQTSRSKLTFLGTSYQVWQIVCLLLFLLDRRVEPVHVCKPVHSGDLTKKETGVLWNAPVSKEWLRSIIELKISLTISNAQPIMEKCPMGP